MDNEDFPRSKRRKLDPDTETKEASSVSFDKELFSAVNYDFKVGCLGHRGRSYLCSVILH